MIFNTVDNQSQQESINLCDVGISTIPDLTHEREKQYYLQEIGSLK